MWGGFGGSLIKDFSINSINGKGCKPWPRDLGDGDDKCDENDDDGDDDDDGGDDGEDHGNGDYKPCPAAKPSLISTFVEPWPSRHLLQSCF